MKRTLLAEKTPSSSKLWATFLGQAALAEFARAFLEFEGSEKLFAQKRRLEGGEFLHSFLREGDETLQLIVREGRLFAGALNFDKLTLARHDDVEIHFRVFVFDISEIEQFALIEKANTHGGDRIGQRIFSQFLFINQFLHG